VEQLTIAGIAGSLRKASYNRAALRAAQELAPEGVKIDGVEIGGLPLFSQDEETPLPAPVAAFKAAVAAADAVLICTPEYNYSVPGVLKNAIDWGSRPHGQSAWTHKPVAVMSASPGLLGGARAQYHLRQSFVFLDMYPINQPEVIITKAHEKFDEQGRLKDETARRLIRQLLHNLADWTRRLGQGRA
jgi:chromate reductase, NAD(P)H dehydrogenase (quinone)